jgi:GT2 family glycosyltransferase
MNNQPLVSILIPVLNGQRHIRHCLNAVLKQTYSPTEIIVFDNGSMDATRDIVREEFPQVLVYQSRKNLYVGPTLNEAIKKDICRGDFILLLCADVLIDENFVSVAVARMMQDSQIGVIQAKSFCFNFDNGQIKKTNIIDTVGFNVYRSRRVINRGHGEEDRGQFNKDCEILAYEGAAGFFRKKALEGCQIDDEIMDENYKWMVDDLDLGWRLTLLGWKNYYAHDVICYHDRKTTKRLSNSCWDFIQQRRKIMPIKRKLDYLNMHFTLLKNEVGLLFWRDLWYILMREIQLFLYVLFFEPSTIPAFWEFFILLPKMLHKRSVIMQKRKITLEKLRLFFR